jgi:hypothetical protein
VSTVKNLALGPLKKATVWINELPDCLTIPSETLISSIEPAQNQTSNSVCLGVELYVPVGPFVRYGMLGVEFISDPNKQNLVIEVLKQTASEFKKLNWTLVRSVDEVFAGLPSEYADGVLKAAVECKATSSLGPGILKFGWAAHGKIGSSTDFFERITCAIIELLKSNVSSLSDDKLAEILNRVTMK